MTSRIDAPADDAFDGRAYARDLTTAPGVYRMYAADGALLYVGKAAVLKKRVASYFTKALPTRTASMVAQIARIDVTVTRTSAEALLLENQLIKSLLPRYNVLLRDDKSYPYLVLTRESWPRIAFHRGTRSLPGRYFGPYPSVLAVRDTLNLMQKIFRLRSCEDSVFRNRSRPCLQYQIGRCSAPCVGLVPARDYADSVRQATMFLDGRSDDLTVELTAEMEDASARLDFERAARMRDLITSIRKLQSRQYVDGTAADLDVLACAMRGAQACVMLLMFRDGRNLGTRSFFPKTNGEDSAEEVLAAFVSQYYAEHGPPREIVLDRDIPERDVIEEALGVSAGRKVQLKTSVRGDRAGYLDLVRRNAEVALAAEIGSNAAQRARAEALRDLLGLDGIPQRIECFDISHTMGEATVASCVVFDADGPVRGQYRRYNIEGVAGGDDYAAMRQALERRFRRAVEASAEAVEEPVAQSISDEVADAVATTAASSRAPAVLPDLLLIDGGAGQVAQANAVLADLGVVDVHVVGVAKGEARRAGDETLLLPGVDGKPGRQLHPGAGSLGLQLICRSATKRTGSRLPATADGGRKRGM